MFTRLLHSTVAELCRGVGVATIYMQGQSHSLPLLHSAAYSVLGRAVPCKLHPLLTLNHPAQGRCPSHPPLLPALSRSILMKSLHSLPLRKVKCPSYAQYDGMRCMDYKWLISKHTQVFMVILCTIFFFRMNE